MSSHRLLRPLLFAAALLPSGAIAADRAVPTLKTQPPVPAVFHDRCAKIELPPGTADVPGGDIFGFVSPTEIGDPCSFAFASESTGRAGKRDGRYLTVSSKSQFVYTWSDRLAFAASPFVSAFGWRDVTVNRGALLATGIGADRSSLGVADFDGVSAEALWRVLLRAPGQPLAITLSAEPRWFRRDGLTGYRADGKQLEMKLFADVAFDERWFGAANVVYGLGTQRLDIPLADLQRGSALGLLAALTYQPLKDETGLVQGVFVGAEARYIAGFSGLALNSKVGEALFAGPTLAIAFKGGSMLNLVWSPQAWGRAHPPSAPGALDLDSFERHQFRVKFYTPL